MVGQRFTAKTERGDGEQIVGGAQLAGAWVRRLEARRRGSCRDHRL